MATARINSTATSAVAAQPWKPGTTWSDVKTAYDQKHSMWAPGTTWGDVKTTYDQKYPATPAAPKPTDPASTPKDAQYLASVTGLARNRDDTLAGIGREQNQALAEYGYTGAFDAQGNLTGRSVDTNNPFSRAALMKRSYDQSARGNNTSFAARGQLNSGAFQNAKDNTDFGYLRGMNENERSFDAVIGNLIGRRATANTNYETGTTQAGLDNLARLIGGLV